MYILSKKDYGTWTPQIIVINLKNPTMGTFRVWLFPTNRTD